MKTKYKLLIFFICFTIMITLLLSYSNNNNQARKNWEKENIDVSFSGKIINKKQISKVGRITYIVCVEMEQSNVDDFFINNKKYYTFLKIKNKKAIFFVPGNFKTIDSVSINMNNDGLKKYYDKGRLIQEFPISFSIGYANDEDLKFCDE